MVCYYRYKFFLIFMVMVNLWLLRHAIRVIRRHDKTMKMAKTTTMTMTRTFENTPKERPSRQLDNDYRQLKTTISTFTVTLQ